MSATSLIRDTDHVSVSTAAMTINRPVVAHRIVQTGMLVGLVWKWNYFVSCAYVYAKIPLHDDFFPVPLQSAPVLVVTYLATVISILLNLVTGDRRMQLGCAVVTLLGSTTLCLHQGSYNDMTFVTTWWVSLYSLWFLWRMNDEDQDAFLRRAALLSRLILSIILLGGGVGKWTAEYWSGEVFYDIYFRDRDFWVFNYLRENYDTPALQTMATWYSRQVVVVETLAGLGLWLLPARWAAMIGIVLLASIALFSNFLLFSVLMCLIGMAAVGLFVRRR